MGFLDRVAAGAEFRSVTSGLASPQSWLTDALGGGSTSYSGERVSVEKAVGLGDVYSAVTLIAEAVGGLPFKVYRALPDTDEKAEARGHRMWRILNEKPNPVMDRHRFWSTVTMQLLLWGNAFIRKDRDELGIVESLWILNPQEMSVSWNGVEKTFERRTAQGVERASSDQVLHIYGPSLDGLIGVSPISLCRDTFGTGIARAKFEGGFYRRGARSPAVIEHPGRLGAQGTKNLADSFKAWHGGVENMHKVPVLEEGAKLNALSMPLADMQFIESKQLSRQEFANVFHLPASYLNASSGDSLTYATIESNSIQFGSLSVAPWTGTIAGAVNADPSLFPQSAVFAEHVLEALYKADVKSRSEYWKALKDMGVVDAAYIASRENLPAPPEPALAPPAAVADPAANGNGVVPAEMVANMQLLKTGTN